MKVFFLKKELAASNLCSLCNVGTPEMLITKNL